MYTLDTNAILYYLKDDTAAVAVLRGIFAETSALYVSAITELPLLIRPEDSPVKLFDTAAIHVEKAVILALEA